MVLKLTRLEAAYLRECLAGRDALEVWTGDGTHWPDPRVDKLDLYDRLGGTFDKFIEQMTELAKPHEGHTPYVGDPEHAQ